MTQHTKTVVALAADLIFAARIRAAADTVRVILAKDVEDFLTKIRTEQPQLIVLDLDRRGLDVQHVVRQIKTLSDAHVLAYVSHVRADLIAAARDAGADRVMARGAFAKEMQAILRLEL